MRNPTPRSRSRDRDVAATSYLALDARGAQEFRRFLDELRALQATLAGEPPASWKMTPAILEANINA